MSRTFRYFRDSHHFAGYSATPQECPVCHQTEPGYAGALYGDEDWEFVCEGCLQEGRLAEHGVFTNDGSPAVLVSQLRERRPDLGHEAVSALARERTEELMHRTPAPQVWQQLEWPAHCGDYCCYVKEAGKADLAALAPDGDGQAFLAAHLAPEYQAMTDVASLWEAMRPDSPQNIEVAWSTGVYLFQCLECGHYVIHWDCD